jgi:hypothetical protein
VKNTRGTRQPMQTDLCHYYCSTIFRVFFFYFAVDGSNNRECVLQSDSVVMNVF